MDDFNFNFLSWGQPGSKIIDKFFLSVRNTAYFEQMFIIREVNSDMPIYILTEQMSETIKCPERDSNPRHPDLMEGALITELPRQPQWSESNICYKGNIDYQTFAPRPLGLGITSVGRRDVLFIERVVHCSRTISFVANIRLTPLWLPW